MLFRSLARSRIEGIPQNNFQIQNAPYDPRSYTDPIVPSYQAPNAPYDPAAQRYATDSNDMRVSSAIAQLNAANAETRADAQYNEGNLSNQLGQNYATGYDDFQQRVDAAPYDPAQYNVQRYRDDVQDAFWQRQSSLLEPSFTQQRERLVQQLADQGIPVGSDAHNSAMAELRRNQGEQRQRIASEIGRAHV